MLVKYAISSSNSSVPLPSNLTEHGFTIGAFDNFDHEEATLSGLHGTHDIVMVLFQDASTTPPTKPSVSSMNLDNKNKRMAMHLPCQILRNYHHRERVLHLPESTKFPENL